MSINTLRNCCFKIHNKKQGSSCGVRVMYDLNFSPILCNGKTRRNNTRKASIVNTTNRFPVPDEDDEFALSVCCGTETHFVKELYYLLPLGEQCKKYAGRRTAGSMQFSVQINRTNLYFDNVEKTKAN